MTPALPTDAPTPLTAAEVRCLLREIGFVLWLSRRMTREIVAGARPPVRPVPPEAHETMPAACAA